MVLNSVLELGKVPLVTRVTCLSSTFLSVVFWIVRYSSLSSSVTADPTNGVPSLPERDANVPSLTMVASKPVYLLWTLFTASFVASNILSLVMSLSIIFFGGRYLERIFSSKEFLKFLAVIVLASNTVLLSGVSVMAILTHDASWLDMPIYGSNALHAGVLVAFKQQIPEHTVSIAKSPVKMRVRHLPMLFLMATVVSVPVLGYVHLCQATLGFLSSWIYLRFYKTSVPDLGAQTLLLRGDASETFALSQFFPEVLQPPVERIAHYVYESFLSLGVVKPLGSTVDDYAEAGRKTAGTGVGRAEAERRRALALKALDDHLTKDTAVTVSDLPPQVTH